MPQSTRASRRQRGGPAAPPPRKDPMRNVYIGFVALLVVVVAGFAFLHWQQTREIEQAYATPSPAASGVIPGKPIQLADGESLGVPYFKLIGPSKLPVTPRGGMGQPIDGIECATQEFVTLHVHSHLAIFDNGKQVQVPRGIGLAPVPPSGCLYWLHTHDASGIIHVEAPRISSPTGGPFNLGMFFDIWGEPLTATDVAGIKGPVTVYMDGVKYDGDARAIPLLSHQQIVLEVGTPPRTTPYYTFPSDD